MSPTTIQTMMAPMLTASHLPLHHVPAPDETRLKI